jgi:hypothetical protein
MAEETAFAGEPVDVRGVDVVAAVAAEIAAQVVHADPEDVHAVAGLAGAVGDAAAQGKGGEAEQ